LDCLSASSASKKTHALFDALLFRWLMILILQYKCIKCINILVNTHVPISLYRVEWVGDVLMHLMHLSVLHSDFDALLMH
jgi:hypothetical protein